MKLILKDGTEIQNATAGQTDNMLELKMTKDDATGNILKLMDPNVMDPVIFYMEASETVYHGFGRFSHMENISDSEIRVWIIANGPYSVEEISHIDPMYAPKGV